MGNRYDDEEAVRAVFEGVKRQHRKEKKGGDEVIDARAKAEWIMEAVKAFTSKGEGLPYAHREYVVQMLDTLESDTGTMEKLSQTFGLSFGSEWEYDVPYFQMVAEFLYVLFRYHPKLAQRVIEATGDAEIYGFMAYYCSAS